MTDQPNILFLMSDEHRPDVTGYEGNPVVRTPLMDKLAREGIVFRNAYTASPICMPTRQCMAAGQLPRTCGSQRYGEDLPPFSMTFSRRLGQYGYSTVCCGKLHHDGPDQMQGWERRIGSNTRVITPDPDAVVPPDHPTRHMPYKLRDKDVWEIQNAGVGRGSGTQVPDELSTLGVIRFLEARYTDPYYDRVSPNVPTLLKLSYNRPHYPYLTTEELFTYYLPRVPIFDNEPLFDHPFLAQRCVKVNEDVTPREITRATAAYYGMIEEIDTDYAKVMDHMHHVGQDPDDWWIIYTSDHGEMLGEHSIWEKQKFFEASARIPFIIRPPRAIREAWGVQPGSEWDGRAGRVVNENINLCDLFATLCDITNTPLPDDEKTVNGAGLDSRSLLPLMQGQADEWHTRYHNESISQFGATNLMIKRDDLKYQRYDREDCTDQPEVLFDLAAEPDERRNLINEPKYANAIATFRKRCSELGFGDSPDAAYRNAGYGK